MTFNDCENHTWRRWLALGLLLLMGPLVEAADRRLSLFLSGETGGYKRATQVREFSFPADHGPHHDFKVEWWYFTGNLDASSGERFGFQLTFFRFGIGGSTSQPKPAAKVSSWRAGDVYMAHFAITDIAVGAFYAAERVSRGALGLAGAQSQPIRVWLEGWWVRLDPASDRWYLHAVHEDAGTGGVALDLALSPLKPLTLQGDLGLSRKSAASGNASYYYSITRMAANGTITTPRGHYRTTGLAWLDREWSTRALDEGQVGWDWFALQLDDGRDLMFYQLRRDDGSADAASAGVVVDSAGGQRRLSLADVTIDITRHWVSPHGGRRYPAGWIIRGAGVKYPLHVAPLLDAQEHLGVVPYWEGAVQVLGEGGREIGRGYVEMTGY